VYKFIEPDSETERLNLLHVSEWLWDQLGDEKMNELRIDYIKYRDQETVKGNRIYPWYNWITQQVHVVIKN